VSAYSLTVGHANLGRARTVTPVRESMDTIRHLLEQHAGPVVLGLNEIDEGDKTRPTDHQLLRETFTHGWQRTQMSKREPILLHGIKVRQPWRRRSYKAAPGVTHQSPSRSWQVDVVTPAKGCPPVAVLCGHYPAGARNGQRNPHVHDELEAAYVKMQAAEKRLIAAHLAAGRQVVILADRNWRGYRPGAGGHIAAHHGPDFISVFPAAGWRLHVADESWHPLSIEKLHGLSVAGLRFESVA